jgi:hypothetical protein
MDYEYNDYLADKVELMRHRILPPYPGEYDHDVFRQNVNFEFDPETCSLRFAWAHCPDSDRVFILIDNHWHVYHGMTREGLIKQLSEFIEELVERGVTLPTVAGYGRITECVVARCGARQH